MKNTLIHCQLYKALWLPLMTLLFINTSCKRLDGETLVEGQVVDQHTGEPIPDATLVIFSGKSNSSSAAYNTVVFEKQTNNNGKFEFKFDSDGSKSYVLRAFKDPGYFTAWDYAAYLDEGRNNKKIKLKTQAPAWVKVKLVNVPPLDKVKSLHIQPFLDMIDGQVSTNLSGFQRDTTFVRMVLGNTDYSFLYVIYPLSGGEVRSNPALFFPAMDTTELLLCY